MSKSRGSIWQAAKRGEGYQLARNSQIVWVITFVLGFCFFVGRFLSGRPLVGDRKTDALWGEPGTKLLHPNSRPPMRWSNNGPLNYCWAAQTERRRALVRLLALGSVIGGVWIWTAPESLIGWYITVPSFLILIGHTKSITAYKNWRHHRGIIKPLQVALAPIFDQTPRETVIHLPRGKKAS
jgi:hypothetical protein